MKKLVTLFLAAGMLLTSVAGASAIEFKPSGNITVGAAWYSNLQTFRFMSPDDVQNNWYYDDGLGNPNSVTNGWASTYTPHKSVYRMNYGLNLDFIASEQLSGRIGFGHDRGPNQHTFGDGNHWNVRVTSAYFDWHIPGTPVEVRMGRWDESPSTFAVGTANPFSGDPEDGVRIKAQFNDYVGVTALWYRRDNTAALTLQDYGKHTADQFYLAVPVTLDGVSVTPWFNYLRIGENSKFLDLALPTKTSYFTGNPGDPAPAASIVTFRTYDSYSTGYLPLQGAVLANTWNQTPATAPDPGDASDQFAGGGTLPYYNQAGFVDAGQSSAWTLGIGGSITKLTPFTFAFDFAYSSLKATPAVQAPNNTTNLWLVPAGDDFMNRHGWMLAASIAYRTDWGTPTLKGWYTTGDDDDITNGSERPLNPNSNKTGVYSFFGNGSDLQLGYNTGLSLAGTWGFSAQWVGASFIDKLTHTLGFSYIHGNNDPFMAQFIPNPTGVTGTGSGFNAGGYMTKNDSVWALELRNSYKIYKELTMAFDMFYAWQNFDSETWSTVWDPTEPTGGGEYGAFVPRNYAAADDNAWDGMQFSNAWGIGLSFRYAF